MFDAELSDDRNQVDVKLDPYQACFFENTRCSQGWGNVYFNDRFPVDQYRNKEFSVI